MPKRKTVLTDPNTELYDTFEPTDEEREFIVDAYQSFLQCYDVREEALEVMGWRKPDTFWADSERDFLVVDETVQSENEQAVVKKYSSTISRDKTNVYIAHIAGALMYPDTVAQNAEQGIDRVWSRVGSSLLYWAHRNDGWPSENGQQKAERVAHTVCSKGTSFCLDIVTKDGLESEEIQPEELYFPTLWQPNLQKLPVVFRAKLNTTYEEAEAMFGHLDNFKYVTPGSDWLTNSFVGSTNVKDGFAGIVKDKKVCILYVWKTARPDELEMLKKSRKVWSNATRGTFYNVLINGIPMFPIDNASPYKHGFLPISRCIFEMLRSDFIYGNSVPNKMMEDKKWRDDWKTLMRFKGKLGALPPTLIIGGHIDDQIVLPSAQTHVPEGVEVQAVPGITGITDADIKLMNMADSEIDRSTVAPSAAGQRPDSSQTARAEVIQAAASQKLLEPFSRQFGYFMQSRSFPILLALLQFINRKSIKKIVVPDQTLADGAKGTFEIIFEDTSALSEIEKLQKSFEIRDKEKVSRQQKQPKDIAYVSPKAIQDIKFYLFSDVSEGLMDKNIIRQQEFAKDMKEIILPRPDLANAKEALQYYFQMKGYPERILTSASQEQQQPGQQGQGVNPLGQQDIMPTEGDAIASGASKAATGQSLPALA